MSAKIQFTNINLTKDSDGNITGATVPVSVTSQIEGEYFSTSGTYTLKLDELTGTGFDAEKFENLLSQKTAENLSAMVNDLTVGNTATEQNAN
ncbi:hypothetical protein DXF96_00100 [Heyndrickxia coagulans]|uniref:hypothetical protein n=1 Tax=Heyndrickxia coagulans TaxID=1398 RepID=UPI000D730945|nr:hypothetical protein [Heyndrickxia coagulans]AWP37762.1 hypothetical protein CYJ15_12610 [Heyndrickxia coagulans]MED4962965.1 hypothetical protein [Heyndrickxia coagulans]QDI60075.1 hypothetical protein DXF96_00100 [Heyndrickxia coagulans]